MKVASKPGAAIAAAAATLFLAGMSLSTVAQAADGQCMGANACKGQSACKGGKSPAPGARAFFDLAESEGIPLSGKS